MALAEVQLTKIYYFLYFESVFKIKLEFERKEWHLCRIHF